MAEPVGITGTAAGLVSLGLQLYDGINKYLGAVKGRQKDLDSARRLAETMQKCLRAINEAKESTTDASVTVSDAVSDCVFSCENELKALEALVTRLQGSTTPAETLSAKAKEKARKYTFPFHRDSILELEGRLHSTNQVLQTALHALGL